MFAAAAATASMVTAVGQQVKVQLAWITGKPSCGGIFRKRRRPGWLRDAKDESGAAAGSKSVYR